MRKILFLSLLSLVLSLTFISTVPAQSSLASKLSQAPTSQPQPTTGISVGAAKTLAARKILQGEGKEVWEKNRHIEVREN